MLKKNILLRKCCINLLLIFVCLTQWGWSQTVRVNPQSYVGAVPPIYRPGNFFTPKTTQAAIDFINDGITYNTIRTIHIELALNYYNVNSISGVMSVLEAFKPDIIATAQRCDKLVIPILKMPAWMSSSSDTNFIPNAGDPSWRMYHAYPPANYAMWNLLVDSIVSKINDQWGLSPYYEIWNEPDNFYWQGTPTEYFTFFKNTYFTIRNNHPTARIGGPVVSSYTSCFGYVLPFGHLTNTQLDSTIIGQLIDSCVSWNAHLDFISWHKFDPVIHAVKQEVTYLDQKLLASGHGPTLYIVTEWNQTYSLRDTKYTIAYMPNYVLALDAMGVPNQLVAAWQDFDPDTIEFHHDYGLLSTGSLHKPAWKSLQLLGRMQGNRIAVNASDVTSFAVTSTIHNDTIQTLFSNYAMPGIYQAYMDLLFEKSFNTRDLEQAGFFTLEQLDSIFNGQVILPVTDTLSSAINQEIPLYNAANTDFLNARTINYHIAGLTGNHSGYIYVVDSINNNIISRYDSLITAGYSRLSALLFLYPNTTINGIPITITDSVYTFQLAPHAVALIEVYGVPLSTASVHSAISSASIFPNPASEFCTVLYPDAVFGVSVFDNAGKLVFQQKKINQKIEIPTQGWRLGAYVVAIDVNGELVHQEQLIINK